MLLKHHHSYHISKDVEILLFQGFERMFEEKWQDNIVKMFQLSYAVTQPISVIRPDNAAAEKGFERFQDFHVSLMLYHNELWQHLHTERHFRMGCDAYMEASFSIRETNDPLCF